MVSYLVLVLRQFVAQLLHLLQERLALVKFEVGLREVLVEAVLAHLHPLLAHLQCTRLVNPFGGEFFSGEPFKKHDTY